MEYPDITIYNIGSGYKTRCFFGGTAATGICHRISPENDVYYIRDIGYRSGDIIAGGTFEASFKHGRWTKYHYSLLKDDMKKAYRIMFDAMRDGELEVRFPASMGKLPLLRIMSGVLNDYPLIFWYDDSYKSTESKKGTLMEFNPNVYYRDRKQYDSKIERFAERLFRDNSDRFTDEFETELFVHDYIAENITYDKNGGDGIHRITGPVIDSKGVCDGISDLTNYLLNAFGVRATSVNNHEPNQTLGHSWNIVAVDGRFYHLDVTFDMSASPCSHSFMNISDMMMAADRQFTRYVHCDSLDSNYYKKRGCWFRTLGEASDHIVSEFKRGSRKAEVYIEDRTELNDLLETVSDGLSKRNISVKNGISANTVDRHGFTVC